MYCYIATTIFSVLFKSLQKLANFKFIYIHYLLNYDYSIFFSLATLTVFLNFRCTFTAFIMGHNFDDLFSWKILKMRVQVIKTRILKVFMATSYTSMESNSPSLFFAFLSDSWEHLSKERRISFIVINFIFVMFGSILNSTDSVHIPVSIKILHLSMVYSHLAISQSSF